MATMITGLFCDRKHVDMAVGALLAEHYNAEDISVVVAKSEQRHAIPLVFKTGVARGAVIGAVIGTVVGGVGAVLTSTAGSAAPGLVLFAGGPLRAAIQGIVAGIGFGGLAGGVSGLGMWREDAELSEKELRDGRVLVGVPVRGENAAEIHKALESVGALRVTVCDMRDASREQARV